MLTNDDVKIIRGLVKEEVTDAITKAVAPLATQDQLKSLVTKDEAKSFATKDDLKKTEERLIRAIKQEHKVGGEILQICEVEDRKIKVRVEKIEHHLGFASA